jgi:hypothetical protein
MLTFGNLLAELLASLSAKLAKLDADCNDK